jgi:hypothetical protein
LIEYLCEGRTAGTVAFLPMQGNTNPYESMDCMATTARGVLCKLGRKMSAPR